MPIPDGHLGNLTAEQEVKLKEFWALTLKTFGVQDPDTLRSQSISTEAPPAAEQESGDKRRKSKFSLFSRKHDDSSAAATAKEDDPAGDDKYGQAAELQTILANQSGESLRVTYWTMLKADHPDQFLLRFLRARKWDVNKALAMLISTLHWRSEVMKVDDDIIYTGEEGALKDEQSSDSHVKKEGADFLEQMRMGKSFLHGTDIEGRPTTYVRVKLHFKGQQTDRALERFTVYLIETARLSLKPPVETACIVFDLTDFRMANMDYTPVKFMIKVFEANYPESLGAVLVHNPPWVFQTIWKLIRGWLDPVVAAKVHFTNGIDGISEFIPRNQVIKALDGEEDWEYQYVEPVEGENATMKDTDTRDRIQTTRKEHVQTFQRQTFDWIHASASSEILKKAQEERNHTAKQLSDNYWELDPYIRARSLYDRVGMIQPGGKINFYPQHTPKPADGGAVATTGAVGDEK